MAIAPGKGALLAAEISKDGAGTGKGIAPHSNVFVGNIAAATTEDDLRAAFSPFGVIESVLLTTKAGRPSAFVKMAEDDAASSAIAGLNGHNEWMVKFAHYDVGQAPKWNPKGWMQKGGNFKGFKGWPVKGGYGFGFGGKGGKGWGPAISELHEDGPEKPEPPASDNLYVKHLPLSITEESLQETLGKLGDIQELRILRPQYALECAALIRYASEEQAAAARTNADGVVPQGTTEALFAKSQTKQGASKDDHVYIKNIPTNTTDENLKALFSKYGEVKWLKVMRTTVGQTRIGATCAALVEMSSVEEAAAAIAALSEANINFADLCPPMKVRYAANKAAAKAGVAASSEEPVEEAMATPHIPETRLAASS